MDKNECKYTALTQSRERKVKSLCSYLIHCILYTVCIQYTVGILFRPLWEDERVTSALYDPWLQGSIGGGGDEVSHLGGGGI